MFICIYSQLYNVFDTYATFLSYSIWHVFSWHSIYQPNWYTSWHSIWHSIRCVCWHFFTFLVFLTLSFSHTFSFFLICFTFFVKKKTTEKKQTRFSFFHFVSFPFIFLIFFYVFCFFPISFHVLFIFLICFHVLLFFLILFHFLLFFLMFFHFVFFLLKIHYQTRPLAIRYTV